MIKYKLFCNAKKKKKYEVYLVLKKIFINAVKNSVVRH